MDLSLMGIKALLVAFGPKATAYIIGGYGVFYLAKSLGGFFERMLARRDEMISQTAVQVAEFGRQAAQFQKETATIIAAMRADTANQLAEARDTRKEMHQRFNKIQEDVTTIKGAVS